MRPVVPGFLVGLEVIAPLSAIVVAPLSGLRSCRAEGCLSTRGEGLLARSLDLTGLSRRLAVFSYFSSRDLARFEGGVGTPLVLGVLGFSV